jgi:hypothetical protein
LTGREYAADKELVVKVIMSRVWYVAVTVAKYTPVGTVEETLPV